MVRIELEHCTVVVSEEGAGLTGNRGVTNGEILRDLTYHVGNLKKDEDTWVKLGLCSVLRELLVIMLKETSEAAAKIREKTE